MDGRDGLQLFPGTKKRLNLKVPGENRFLYIGSAILGAALVTSFWFNFNIKSLEDKIKQIDEQLFILEQRRDKTVEQNLKILKQQLMLTSQLLDGHIYWTQAISKMENLVHEQVQVKSVSFALGGEKISMLALANGYTIIARQIASFISDDAIKDFSLGEMKPQTDGKIEFSMELNFDKVKLIQKKK